VSIGQTPISDGPCDRAKDLVMRTTITAVLSIALVVLQAAADVGPTWQEDPDAGSVPSTSQGVRATGVGTVNRIIGTTTATSPFTGGLAGMDLVDLYEIDITSPAGFMVGTGPDFDSRLFLFRREGTSCSPIAVAVAASHRRAAGVNGSELKAIPGLAAGTYYVAITGAPAVPRGWVAAGSGGYSLVDLFAFPADGVGTQFPLVAGAALAEWTTPVGTAAGSYSMTVGGVTPKVAAICSDAGRALVGVTAFDLAGGSTSPETLPSGCEPGIAGMTRTIWLRHTAACDGALTVGVQPTSPTQNPLAIVAWLGCCEQRIPVGCDAAGAPAGQASIVVPVRAGDDVLLAIGVRMTSSTLPASVTGDLFIECTPTFACGDERAGSCFSPHDTPFCNAGDCCSAVCAVDPNCCAVMWDGTCVDGAMGVCIESTPNPDINGDGSVDGKDLALLLSSWGT
jgi:hypothetical protein